MIHDWDLASTNLQRVEHRTYEVGVLVTAAIEPHNRHLPYGQDLHHATGIARRSCDAAWAQGAAVCLLPSLPFGVDCNLMGFPMTIHVRQETLDAMIRDVVESLRHHGVRKIVVINGHGGNDFKPLARQLPSELDVAMFLCDWWRVGMDRYDEIFDRPEDHAGQMETSVAMAMFPEMTAIDQAQPVAPPAARFEALRRGWVYASRDFTKLGEHCATADPAGATPERGQAYLDLVCERITKFLVELAAAEMDETFPFEGPRR